MKGSVTIFNAISSTTLRTSLTIDWDCKHAFGNKYLRGTFLLGIACIAPLKDATTPFPPELFWKKKVAIEIDFFHL